MTISRSLAAAALTPFLALGIVSGSPVSAQSAHRVTHVVHAAIHGFAFGPKRLVVTVGTKVIWTNKDSANHTVSGDSGNPARFESRTLGHGHTYSFTFKKAGTYKYHCAFHQFMHAIVVVHKKG